MSKKDKGNSEAVTKGAISLAAKKQHRAEQSAKDKRAARYDPDYVQSRKIKELTTEEHRCRRCEKPSADVRRGKSKHCNRCSARNGMARKAVAQ